MRKHNSRFHAKRGGYGPKKRGELHLNAHVQANYKAPSPLLLGLYKLAGIYAGAHVVQPNGNGFPGKIKRAVYGVVGTIRNMF